MRRSVPNHDDVDRIQSSYIWQTLGGHARSLEKNSDGPPLTNWRITTGTIRHFREIRLHKSRWGYVGSLFESLNPLQILNCTCFIEEDWDGPVYPCGELCDILSFSLSLHASPLLMPSNSFLNWTFRRSISLTSYHVNFLSVINAIRTFLPFHDLAVPETFLENFMPGTEFDLLEWAKSDI